MFLYEQVYVHVYLFLWKGMCVCMCVSQTSVSGGSPQEPSTLFFETWDLLIS